MSFDTAIPLGLSLLSAGFSLAALRRARSIVEARGPTISEIHAIVRREAADGDAALGIYCKREVGEMRRRLDAMASRLKESDERMRDLHDLLGRVPEIDGSPIDLAGEILPMRRDGNGKGDPR